MRKGRSRAAVPATLLVFGSLCLTPGFAASLPKGLAHAAALGAKIFERDSFGSHVSPAMNAQEAFLSARPGRTRGPSPFMTCSSCHIHGGRTRGLLVNGRRFPSLRNAAAIFPRYDASSRKVMTLEAQIRHCIAAGIEGRPPPYGSQTMADLVVYLSSLAQGQPLTMGGSAR